MSSNRPLPVLLLLLGLAAAAPKVAAAQAGVVDPSRLYGRVTTTDGSMYEGYIRWDRNEASWFDILSVSKRIPERNIREAEELGWEPAERRERFEIFGIGITLPAERVSVPRTAESGVRFGHVSTLEPLPSGRARVVLKSGQELEATGGGDLGSSVDEVLVEDVWRGPVELEWGEIRTIDFMGGRSRPSVWGDRLYGTLRTRTGEEFTGYVIWDMDELFTTDVLDGEERGSDRDREIPFSRIRAIVADGSRAARVTLVGGETLILSGTNDVNDDNRDILISDPGLGEIRVEWGDFDRLELSAPSGQPPFGAFDGGRRLQGTVRVRGGEPVTGFIRWDNDEEYTWEVLDGRLPSGVDVDIEFGSIASIERVGFEVSRVTLLDGRRLELGGTNDVDENNKGIYVERSDGRMVLVPWDRFERVDFAR